MSAILEYRTWAKAPLAGAALAAVLLLGACSDRDTKLSEAMAAAEQSAIRAEKAALRAEESAKKVGAEPPAPVIEEEEEEPADEAEKSAAEANEPPASEPEAAN